MITTIKDKWNYDFEFNDKLREEIKTMVKAIAEKRKEISYDADFLMLRDFTVWYNRETGEEIHIAFAGNNDAQRKLIQLHDQRFLHLIAEEIENIFSKILGDTQ